MFHNVFLLVSKSIGSFSFINMSHTPLTSRQKVLLKPNPDYNRPLYLAEIIHDAKNKLTIVLMHLQLCEDELHPTLLEILSKMVINVRDEMTQLLKVSNISKEKIDSTKSLVNIEQLPNRLKSILAHTEHFKDASAKHNIAKAIHDFSMLIKQGERCVENNTEQEALYMGNIATYIRSIIEIYEHLYPYIKFDFEIENDYKTTFYPISIKRVIENLLNNSIQALPDEKGQISIRITKKIYEMNKKPFKEIKDGHYLSVEIKDNGIGISKDIMSRISNSCITTKKEGFGIGLRSARNNMTTHKGYLFIESEQNIGTQATALFPIKPSQ